MNQEAKLNKLESLLKMEHMLGVIDASFTKEEFTKAFESLIRQVLIIEKNLIIKIDDKTKSAIDNLEEITKRVEEENQSSFSNMKRWAMERVNTLFIKYQIKEKIAELDEKMSQIKDGEDADEIKIVADVLAKIPPVIPETPEQILDKITGLLEIKDIKDLQEKLEELKNNIGRRPVFGGGGFSKIAMDIHIIDWTVIGTGDGTTTQFTLPHAPNPIESLQLKVGGGELFTTDDWTLSGLIATFLIAPPDGAKIRCKCRI